MFIIESEFEYKGYKCVTTFLSHGWRCGYVGIPISSSLYKHEEDLDFDVHGGITFTGFNHPLQDTGLWWIGFDCSHYNDGHDIQKLKEIWGDNVEVQARIKVYGEECSWEVPRTLKYVQQECRNLVDQIIEYELKKQNDSPSINYIDQIQECWAELYQKAYDAMQYVDCDNDCDGSFIEELDELEHRFIMAIAQIEKQGESNDKLLL